MKPRGRHHVSDSSEALWGSGSWCMNHWHHHGITYRKSGLGDLPATYRTILYLYNERTSLPRSELHCDALHVPSATAPASPATSILRKGHTRSRSMGTRYKDLGDCADPHYLTPHHYWELIDQLHLPARISTHTPAILSALHE